MKTNSNQIRPTHSNESAIQPGGGPGALETAISFAERGWYVFPIQPGLKIPFKGFKWKDLSTNDPEKIRAAAAFPSYAGCNWACDLGKSGLFVVDVDNKPGGPDGNRSAEKLPGPLTSGLEVRTPSGDGYHVYFTGHGPNTVGKLGPGIDTRGQGGYVLIPGSVIDGKSYEFIISGDARLEDRQPVPIPDWLFSYLGSQTSDKKPERDIPLVEPDTDRNVAHAIQYLQADAVPALEGDGGDAQTYEVACQVRDYGVSQHRCLELMLEHYNDRCIPPWSFNDLARKVRNAFEYAKDQPGNRSVEAMFPDPSRSTDHIRCAADMRINRLKPRDWLMKARYLKKYVTVTVAPGGAGKSSLTLLEGLAVATGRRLTYHEVKDTGPVWYYNTEDPVEELELRIAAAALHHKIPADQLKNFYYSSGRTDPLILVADDRKAGYQINARGVEWLIENAKARQAKLLILDPFIRLHGLNENDNTGIDKVVQQLQRVADAADCAISLVHHTSKGKSEHGNMDKARGASALVFAARIAHTLYTMGEDEAKDYAISPQERRWYARLDSAKENLTPPGASSHWFKKISVQLFPEESIGTLERTELDRVVSTDTDELLIRKVAELMTVGEEISAYELGKKLEETRLFEKDKRTLHRKIVLVFSEGVTLGEKSFHLKKVTGRTGGRTEGLVCV